MMIFFIFVSCSLVLAQADSLDTIELKSDKVYQGKVTKVTTTTIEFKDAMTNLDYEFEKDEVKYIKLADGTTLTFTERAQLVGEGEPQQAKSAPPQPEAPPVEADREDDNFVSKTIIYTAGAVVGILLLVAVIF